ncbi:hypothetical protein DC498_19345 [Terrimonas sp.]|nr:hypothetical protein DC498_19345 [Terrimonas sp.]
MGLFSTLFGCGQGNDKKQQTNSQKLADITSRTDISEGFSDIFLTITASSKTDITNIYVGQGLYKNKPVGLKFEINSKLPFGITSDGEINSKSGFVKNGVKFISLGQESDKLINALFDLYNEPTKKTFSRNIISATVFSLNQQDTDFDKNGYYKFKLFFNDDCDENTYAEMFFNINTAEKIIELHEKDHDYRKPLLKAFTD